jgi:hypothetical protein
MREERGEVKREGSKEAEIFGVAENSVEGFELRSFAHPCRMRSG